MKNVFITELEQQVLRGIINSDFFEGIDFPVWTWSVDVDFIETRKFSGVMSSLNKKGLIKSSQGEKKDDETVKLTKEGLKAYEEKINF